MKGTLYGSLTSPYSRLVRLVRQRAGADRSVAFKAADAFDDAYRQVNPLGKVPALILDNETSVLETTLIVRTLMTIGGTDLLPQDPSDRIQAEADMALAMGVLDLGVAFLLEGRRPVSEQSSDWQKRRLAGLTAALPALDEAAIRAAQHRGGAPALALAVTCDWLSFRLGEELPWQNACPNAASLTASLLAEDDVAATDPRLA